MQLGHKTCNMVEFLTRMFSTARARVDLKQFLFLLREATEVFLAMFHIFRIPCCILCHLRLQWKSRMHWVLLKDIERIIEEFFH